MNQQIWEGGGERERTMNQQFFLYESGVKKSRAVEIYEPVVQRTNSNVTN